MKAIRVDKHGGAEALRCENLPLPDPGPGEARVRLEAIGVNYIDVYHRTGLYHVECPFTPGVEGAGVVEAVGPGVAQVKPGDRVAYAMILGSYAEYAVAPADRLVPLPDGIDFRSGAAVLLQGMTAHYLTHSTYPLSKGHVALVHAAAGGVGLLLIQMAKRREARVFGTVSTKAKAKLAREAGADEVIVYTQTDFADEVKRLTGGRGVDVVYDSVGQATFEKSLDCLKPRGYVALFGNASGPVGPLDLAKLGAKGSLFVTRPSLPHYTLNREELLGRSGDLFRWLSSGELELRVETTFPLANARDAHRELEGRKTTGKVLLIP